MRNIEEALREHKKCILDHDYNEKQLLGIFVYGSQNYETATENSDVDTKAVLIPSLKNLAIHPIKTKELHLENGEHCEIMDIMHLVSNFRKQNINFIEILYTKYYWINPIYAEIWEYYFIKQREFISHYDMHKCIQSICGQAIHTLRQNPYDGKKVGNGIRLAEFLSSYIAGELYETCIAPRQFQKDTILNMKYKTLETDQISQVLLNTFESLKKLDISELYSKNFIDEKMNEGIICLIKQCDYELGL